MSFPYHDRSWIEAVGVLLSRLDDNDTVLAPDRFWWALPVPMQRWVGANFQPDSHFDWVVVHKGELSWVPRRFLERLQREMTPIFANEVFVIFGPTDRELGLITADENHLRAFEITVGGLSEDPIPENPYETDQAIGDAPAIDRFARADDTVMRSLQEQFFHDGGYEYPTLRDKAYYEDVHALSAEMLDRWAGRDVLDVACAATPVGLVDTSTRMIRFDLSPAGVAMAASADAGAAGVHHAAADAHHLPFPDESFDAVSFVDAIEHVRHADQVLIEVARVLRPGGELFVTYANTNSMNQVLTRRLGYPQFVTNHQHIREFSADELASELAAVGLEVTEVGGVSLYPYWGIPGIDELVRSLTDDDEEVVEMMRYLGKAGGPRYAYTGTALARKAAETSS